MIVGLLLVNLLAGMFSVAARLLGVERWDAVELHALLCLLIVLLVVL